METLSEASLRAQVLIEQRRRDKQLRDRVDHDWRSNVEAAYSMIKGEFGCSLLRKSDGGQTN